MAKVIEVTELVLRDAHHNLLATRLALNDLIPACTDLGKAGYWSLECWGGATFDSCIRFLNEDPWERLRTFRKLLPDSQLQMLLRGQSLLGYQQYPDDVVEHFIARAAENGIDVFRVFDALNDVRNLRTCVAAIKRAGKHAQGAISYTISPVHTVQSFVEYARELKSIGCDSICIRDTAGLLKPQAAYELVRGIKEQCGPETRVHLHAHATTGMTLVTYMKAVEAGVDGVDTAISSLYMGAGHNPAEIFAEMLEATGFHTRLDLEHVRRATRYFATLRPKYREDFGDYPETDTEIFEHQVPAGMITNIQSQLAGQDASERLDEVLAEIRRVRADCGFSSLVTPASQIVGTQAVFNVLRGKYQVMTGEFADLMLGYYGSTLGEKNPDVLKIAAQRAKKPAINCRPADLLKPQWDGLCVATSVLLRKPSEDEDVLIYAMSPQAAPKFFTTRASGPKELSRLASRSSFAIPEARSQRAQSPGCNHSVTYVVTLNGKEHRITVSRAE